jgi:DNA-binding winged helix-turn-helix (wHTH) protein
MRFDLFELDSRSFQLRRGGMAVDLPPQALRILVLLATYPNELVSRKQIKDVLWPEETHGDFDSRMNFAVKKLREALGDSAEQPRYIQTVRNAGYMFIAPVRLGLGISSNRDENLAVSRADSPQVTGLTDAGASIPQRRSRFGLRATLVAVVAVAASAVAFGRFILEPHEASPAPQSESGTKLGISNVDNVPKISSVSPILPRARQRIVVEGGGFGMQVPYSRTDSPYLAIRDETKDWAAGRILPHNFDEVMLDVQSWTDSEIVISGFSGEYGANGWVLAEGDKLEVRVWNPQSGIGPARFQVVVASSR